VKKEVILMLADKIMLKGNKKAHNYIAAGFAPQPFGKLRISPTRCASLTLQWTQDLAHAVRGLDNDSKEWSIIQ